MTASVLVVDDEADFLATYDRLLRRQGYRTITATTLQAALESERPAKALGLMIPASPLLVWPAGEP